MNKDYYQVIIESFSETVGTACDSASVQKELYKRADYDSVVQILWSWSDHGDLIEAWKAEQSGNFNRVFEELSENYNYKLVISVHKL